MKTTQNFIWIIEQELLQLPRAKRRTKQAKLSTCLRFYKKIIFKELEGEVDFLEGTNAYRAVCTIVPDYDFTAFSLRLINRAFDRINK